MGANAQTSVLDFTNGQVLTGPEMDISAGTGVPVFATTVTRDAAFGGANKVLAEGQTCYLESTNVVQYYDGAAWATVGPTVAAASGLTLITAVTFSPAATISMVSGIFSATYANYLVVLNVTAVVGIGTIGVRFNSAGTPVTSGYFGGFDGRNESNVATGLGFGSASSMTIGYSQGGTFGPAAYSINVNMPLGSPAATASIMGTGRGFDSGGAEMNIALGARHRGAAAYDGLTFIYSSTSIAGNYRVYGLAN